MTAGACNVSAVMSAPTAVPNMFVAMSLKWYSPGVTPVISKESGVWGSRLRFPGKVAVSEP